MQAPPGSLTNAPVVTDPPATLQTMVPPSFTTQAPIVTNPPVTPTTTSPPVTVIPNIPIIPTDPAAQTTASPVDPVSPQTTAAITVQTTNPASGTTANPVTPAPVLVTPAPVTAAPVPATTSGKVVPPVSGLLFIVIFCFDLNANLVILSICGPLKSDWKFDIFVHHKVTGNLEICYFVIFRFEMTFRVGISKLIIHSLTDQQPRRHLLSLWQ